MLKNNQDSDMSLLEPNTITVPEPAVTPKPKIALPSPEQFLFLLDRMNAPVELSPEEIKEEARINEEQVNYARGWLESPDPQQRINGAEQLSAYPTRQAEKLLAKSLLNDLNPEVRSAAARSLGYIENPRSKTVSALLAVLNDGNDDIGVDALNTLIAYVAQEPYASKRARFIIKKLRRIAKAKQLLPNTQAVMRDFLADQSLPQQAPKTVTQQARN
ncbi:MAG: HEAT repeat domain-containing protein [Gammaproteobacteria bacterium]